MTTPVKEGFNAEEFEAWSEKGDDDFWNRSRNKLIEYLISQNFPDFKSFLEVGCGTGFAMSGLVKAFPGRDYVGVEMFEEGLRHARKRLPGIKLLQMDARELNFTEEFDLLGSFDVLEHITEDEDVMARMYKALKPGGGLVVSVPQHQWLWSAHDENLCHVRRYSNRELLEKLRRAGFTIVRSLSFLALLFPAMVGTRLLRKFTSEKNLNDNPELHIPGWLDKVFEKALSVERGLVKLGVNFPCGGSRVVVARKES
ncbi:class I SAM-dependent methyltransferase [Deltaproteobacteria bacterium OttesenSCG-928-K17]|nr:class I SAM-dependent methyltransferase [Deltaproteobacteria bacterium OttesenSCG-928-K17]